MHQDVIVAIAVICQIALQSNPEDLFEVEYSDQMTEKGSLGLSLCIHIPKLHYSYLSLLFLLDYQKNN
jgi:hypothetical protein